MHTLDSPNDSASASVDMHVMRCPFCNSDSIRRGMNEHSHWLECSYCRAEGPGAQTPAKAILAWNRRTFAVVPPQANPQPDSGSLTPDDEQTTAPVDTVSFVQEWLMTGDYAPDQWHRDFAAAIDGRAIKTAEANDAIAALTAERDRLRKAVEPFAEAAGAAWESDADGDGISYGSITVGHIRAARDAFDNVGSPVDDWRERAERAEGEVERLRVALEALEDLAAFDERIADTRAQIAAGARPSKGRFKL